ncbi:odorant receptor 67c-like [Phymastichus coffea]|uniref:odorant receptor 67c-like n=1 Tax=Phymastichus coffea TaxID=108790 RepID=UPI00273CF12A|nr:odorant receptor 67c-like [Phymastichus coffea]
MENEIDETGIEYKIFAQTFFFLKLAGFWKPTTMKHRWLRSCYDAYTVFAFISINLIAGGTFLEIILAEDDMLSHFLENWFITAIITHTSYNGLNIAIKRRQIVNVLQKKFIAERWTNLRDAEEMRIIESSKDIEQKVLRYWMDLIAVNAVVNLLNPIITENPDNDLIINSWIPYDRNVPSCFWMCYTQQVISWTIATITNVSACTIILNFIERICSHIRILQRRLTMLPELVQTGVINTAKDELFYINECILDHQNIYAAVKDISEIFYASMVMQFILIFSILCTNIYFLSSQPLFSSAFIAVALILCCMMSQFFLFCWWGYKLTQIGNEIGYTIFSMNWFELRKETRKRLRYIMLSASKNITLFDNFIVELSPEMFLKLMKISYSTFNLLKTGS